MIDVTTHRTYGTAARRWEGVGPYYAMFPTSFADDVVARYTSPGDRVLDPFAGRGTAVFSAAHQGRRGFGFEINPVGWVYAKVKISPGRKESVGARILDIADAAAEHSRDAEALPEFFHCCFSPGVRQFLLAAREELDWKGDSTDRTVMALLLVYLHGKRDASLSNQMRQTKSMSPDYAVRWWSERKLTPPDVDPVAFMASRVEWRYAKGVPEVAESEMYLGDSESGLAAFRGEASSGRGRVRLLFTSPPYYALTNYHYDQWLRLWLLGGLPSARRLPGSHELRAKFENAGRYRELLGNVFDASARLMAKDSVVYVRTGRGRVTYETTLDVLKSVWPRHELREVPQPYTRPTQTSLFGDTGMKAGEVDLVLIRS